MGAVGERARLAPGVHATDAGDHLPACLGEEPGQLTLDLDGQLASRGDDEPQRRSGPAEGRLGAEQRVGEDEAEGHRLAGAGSRGDQQVAAPQRLGEDRGLDRRGLLVTVEGEGACEEGVRAKGQEGHGCFLAGLAPQ